MAITIIENYVDVAGWRRIRIQSNGNGESLPLKFPPGTSVADMKAEAQAAIDREIARRQAEAAERQRVRVITDAVERYLEGALTNTQKLNLLEALAREWRG